MTAKSRLSPHVFVADSELLPHPADLEQRSVCVTCHLLGKPGDAHHTVPDAEPDARSAAAGERSEG